MLISRLLFVSLLVFTTTFPSGQAQDQNRTRGKNGPTPPPLGKTDPSSPQAGPSSPQGAPSSPQAAPAAPQAIPASINTLETPPQPKGDGPINLGVDLVVL